MARTTFAHTTHGWGRARLGQCVLLLLLLHDMRRICLSADKHASYPAPRATATSQRVLRMQNEQRVRRRSKQDAKLVTQKFSSSPHEALKLTNILGKNAS